MTFAPITADDLAPSLLALDLLDAELLTDADFAVWCDERADASRNAFDAEQVTL